MAADRYVLACYRYIEMNPVRVGMVDSPAAYAWSSYRGNAGLETNPRLTERIAYAGLGTCFQHRSKQYRQLFEEEWSEMNVEVLRQCVQTGTPFCIYRFRQEIERALDRKVGRATRGRPRKDTRKGL